MSEDDVFLALAKHVPALSTAVGASTVLIPVVSDNIDLNTADNCRQNWGRDESHRFGTSWLHSDLKDMAYFYIYEFFNQLVTRGYLR